VAGEAIVQSEPISDVSLLAILGKDVATDRRYCLSQNQTNGRTLIQSKGISLSVNGSVSAVGRPPTSRHSNIRGESAETVPERKRQVV
jgi:hypothetical protein